MYSFDPVGSYERETYRAGGSASSMLQPLLDNQVSSSSCSIKLTIMLVSSNVTRLDTRTRRVWKRSPFPKKRLFR